MNEATKKRPEINHLRFWLYVRLFESEGWFTGIWGKHYRTMSNNNVCSWLQIKINYLRISSIDVNINQSDFDDTGEMSMEQIRKKYAEIQRMEE